MSSEEELDFETAAAATPKLEAPKPVKEPTKDAKQRVSAFRKLAAVGKPNSKTKPDPSSFVVAIDDPVLDDVLENRLPAPYTRENFHGFLKGQMAEESLEFYEKVMELKKKVSENDNRSTAESDSEIVSLHEEIVEKYVSDSAALSINISGNLRSDTLKRVTHSTANRLFKVDIFDEAIREVKNLMAGDPFYNFVNQMKKQNITVVRADYRIKVGTLFMLMGLCLTLGFILAAVYSDKDFFKNPLIRLISFPFYLVALFNIVSGREKYCPLMFAFGDIETVVEEKGKVKNTVTKLQDPKLRKCHKKRSAFVTTKIIFISLFITAIGVIIPPSDFYE